MGTTTELADVIFIITHPLPLRQVLTCAPGLLEEGKKFFTAGIFITTQIRVAWMTFNLERYRLAERI